MPPNLGAIVLLALGLLLALLATFAWPAFSKLPVHRLRSSLFGSQAARTMTIVAGLLIAAMGLFLLVA
jgi:type IV secretory pathway TrbD component